MPEKRMTENELTACERLAERGETIVASEVLRLVRDLRELQAAAEPVLCFIPKWAADTHRLDVVHEDGNVLGSCTVGDLRRLAAARGKEPKPCD